MAAPSGAAAAAAADSTGNPFKDFLEQQQQQQQAAAAVPGGPGLCPTATGPITVDTALPVRWMKQEKNGAWIPLRRRDSAKVEAAFLAWEESSGAEAPATVLIEGGRYEVDVPTRRLAAAYWDKDSRPLLRASWFSKPATGLPGSGPSAFAPYSEADAAAVEETYQAALDETVRSLAAGSFLSSSSSAEGLSGSTSASVSASVSSSSKAGRVLLRKEMPLSDGTNKIVVTFRETAASISASASASGAGVGVSQSAGAGAGGSSSKSNKLGLASLPGGVEVEVMQQRLQYGIGVLHNRVLRRGMDPSLEPAPLVEASAAEGRAEEEDEFDREPSHLVFVVHGIGEKMWASDAVQGMLSLRASVEVMRCNVMQQQVRVMEEEPALAAAAGCSKKGGACRKGTGAGTGGEGGECDGSHTSAAASGGEGRRPPSEEATETAPGAAADADASQSGKQEKKKKSRVEFVPVEWFDAIRSDEGSLTRKTQRVTLPTVPLFRQLANDVVMDILLYMNPGHRQRILAAVGERMNKAYARFKKAHPTFSGQVSVVGHSLGSVILFDLLAHQRGHGGDRVLSPLDASIRYPELHFPLDLFMTIGSPIGLFLVVREQELPSSFKFPTVSRFYNVFHPYDPVAYRIEPILQPALAKLDPALVPHHATGTGEKTFVTKAREQKRLVQGNLLALGSTVSAAGRSLLGSLSSFGAAAKPAFAAAPSEEGAALLAATGGDAAVMGVAMATLSSSSAAGERGGEEAGVDDSAAQAEPEVEVLPLNEGRRFDFAIQEGVGESLNEYISAISSHACYFAHPDIAYFLVRLLHRLDDDGTNNSNNNGTTTATNATASTAAEAEAEAEAGVMRV